jgi:hypothetical protein
VLLHLHLLHHLVGEQMSAQLLVRGRGAAEGALRLQRKRSSLF